MRVAWVGLGHMAIEHPERALLRDEKQGQRRGHQAFLGRRDEGREARLADQRPENLRVVLLEGGRRVHAAVIAIPIDPSR